MRPCVSVAGTRCTRWTPLSNLNRAKTPRPETSATISLNPPAVPSLVDRTSTFQRFRSAYLTYMRNRSPANRAASSPPVPARISRIALPSSAASLGRSAIRIALDIASASASTAASSASAMARMSGSRSGSRNSAARSARSFSLDWKAWIAPTTGSSSLSSRDSTEYCAPDAPSARRAEISRWRRRMRSRLSLAAMCELKKRKRRGLRLLASLEPHLETLRQSLERLPQGCVLAPFGQHRLDLALRLADIERQRHRFDRPDRGRGHRQFAVADRHQRHRFEGLSPHLAAQGHRRPVSLACLRDRAQRAQEADAQ